MTARRRELECATRPLLPAHVREVGARRIAHAVRGCRELRLELDLSAEEGNSLGEVADGYGVNAGERRLLRRLRRTEKPLDSEPSRSFSHRENASDPAQPAVESELADGRGSGERGARHLERRAENGGGAIRPKPPKSAWL